MQTAQSGSPGDFWYEWPKNTNRIYIALTQLWVGAEFHAGFLRAHRVDEAVVAALAADPALRRAARIGDGFIASPDVHGTQPRDVGTLLDAWRSS